MAENGDPAPPSDDEVEQVLQASDALVALLHERALVPRHSAAALAIALGRVCGHYDVDMDEAHALAKVLANANVKEIPHG